MEPAQLSFERLLQPPAGKLIIDGKAIEIEVQNSLFVGIARITHPDMGIEPSRPLRERFVDRLGMIGDGDDISISRLTRTTRFLNGLDS
jgi:hypothetical protein